MDIIDYIGNTPIINIQRLNNNKDVNIFAKLEGLNPGGSIKDRAVAFMIKKAEEDGVLSKGKTLAEYTSGNTGIALAMIAATRGYKLKIFVPKTTSENKIKIMKLYGAQINFLGNDRADNIENIKKMQKEDSDLVYLNQYENPEAIKAHYKTAEEIINQVPSKIDYFIAGMGTGGTITGIARKLKEKYPDIKIIGVEPKQGERIEGLRTIKDGYVPKILDLNLVDEIFEVEEDTTSLVREELLKKEGVFAGYSSAASMFVSLKIANRIKSGNIVTIFPDRGERYLNK